MPGQGGNPAGHPVVEVPDEIWLTEHPPIYTLGRDGNLRHLHEPGDIPVVATERGGQITYHGPGQAVAYLLIDLRRRRLGVRDLVCRVEAGVIACLAGFGIHGMRRAGAPGIYVARPGAVDGIAKIASIGLKISYGCSFHGVAVNGRMDLEPFRRIDPCGFPGLQMTDVFTEASTDYPFDPAALFERLGKALQQTLTTTPAPAALP
ncbi:MAG: lipoyl(octanoyl) transferase LipB [Lautropia sp.]